MSKHQYPCTDWLEERSCAECRLIADEQNALLAELKARNKQRARLGLHPLCQAEYRERGH